MNPFIKTDSCSGQSRATLTLLLRVAGWFSKCRHSTLQLYSFCLQSLSFVILLRSPFASPPSLAAYSLLVPHSFSIPSFVRNLGKFSNSIPLLVIFDRRFLVTSTDPRPETRCNRRARPKEKFRQLSQPFDPTTPRSLLSYSFIPYILLYRLYIIYIIPNIPYP